MVDALTTVKAQKACGFKSHNEHHVSEVVQVNVHKTSSNVEIDV